jgi:hypothetical protein
VRELVPHGRRQSVDELAGHPVSIPTAHEEVRRRQIFATSADADTP